ncbi:MAG: hypothetical protein M9896_19265 [Candidatus Promineofilum sp.]|uniref:hypothetical protein n=1 Tax=Promineifilum sp. TaxID=2664178 RepID=UPI002411CB7C|nr:hypothetical protein [Promineifilum sp.]
MADEIKATYIGDGWATWPGVPMRDLSAEEWAGLDKATQTALVKQGLFQAATAPKATAKKDGESK